MSRPRINIATALNSKYMRYTYVMLTSLFMNQPDAEIHVYLLHNDLTEQDQKYLSQLAEAYSHRIHFLLIDRGQFSSNLPTTIAWSLEAYFRLLLLDILPSDVDRLLYLDVDMIIDKPIHELYFTDFEDKLFCVCKDYGVSFEKPDKRQELFKEQLKHDFTYFNSGLMLWNIDKLRGKYTFSDYMDTAARLHFDFIAPDQDLLNYLHWNEVKFVDEYKYDLFSKLAYNHGVHYEDVKRETTIIHFAGPKPWEGEFIHYDIEKLWWDYAKETPFYMELMEEFLHGCICNPLVYDTMTTMSNEKKQLKAELDKSIATCQKLLQMLNV